MEHEHSRMIYEAGLRLREPEAPDVEAELARARRRHMVRRRYMVGVAAAVAVVLFSIPFALNIGTDKGPGSKNAPVYIVDGLGNRVAVDNAVHIIDNAERTDEKSLRYVEPDDVTVVHTHTLLVPKGSDFSLTLADGTVILVNSGSSITYPGHFAADSNRVVTLNYGEAFFKVAHDPSRQFIVKNPMGETKVHGTQFNVRAYDKGMCDVTLVEGSVSVKKHPMGDASCGRILSPGENARVTEQGIEVERVDMQNYVAWIDGYYHYDRKTVMEILEDICKHYDYRVDGSISANDDVRFWFGKNEDMEEVVKRLSEIANVDIEVKGSRLVLK